MFGLSLYQRYVMREVLGSVGLVLLAFLALFSFFDFIGELRRVGQHGYQLWHAALTELLSIPGLVYELIPIATLIGTLYALSNLARHSEITVLRASGMATNDLLITLFRLAGVLALLTFVVGEAVVPFSERLMQEIRTKALSQTIAQSGFATGLWLKDGRTFVNVRRATPDADLQGVRIYRFSEDNLLKSVIDAETASFAAAGHWNLKNGIETVLDGERAAVHRFDNQSWSSAVTPDLLAVLMVAPERMSLTGLLDYTHHLTENRQKSERYRIALWKKLIYPLSVLVMVALALPFGYSHNRVGGVSLKIFSGVMLGILFYALNGLFSNLGAINAWHPLASALAPSAIFSAAAVFMLWWVERR